MTAGKELTRYQLDVAAVLAVESELDLFNWWEGDVPVWRLIRYRWFQSALHARTPAQKSKPPPAKSTSHARIFTERVTKFLRRPAINPARGGRCDLLIIGLSRRVWDNGVWRDPYMDPLLPLLRRDFNVRAVEPVFSGPHRRPSATPDLRYLDRYERLLNRRQKSLATRPLSSSSEDLCDMAQELLRQKGFAAAPSLAQAARTAVASWRAGTEVFTRLFERTCPRALAVVNYVGCQPILAAAYSCGVKTIELQHGSPGVDKLNYHFSQNVSGPGFPDYFFSFGPYWNKHVALPILDGNVRPIGFRYLNEKRPTEVAIRGEAADTVLVISQPVAECQEVLARLACELVCKFGSDRKIAWRPHPADANMGGDLLSRLQAAGVTVTNGRTPLYDEFKRAGTIVGAYSTALFEAVAFGRRPQLVRVRSEASMDALVAAGGADNVSEIGDIAFNALPASGLADELFATPSDDVILGQFHDVIETPLRR